MRQTGKWCGLVAVAALACASLAASSARADDRSEAEDLLIKVDGAAQKSLAAELSAKAREALARAARLRGGGDEMRARLADGLAKRWAQAALDLVGTAADEAAADEARKARAQAEAKLERERALVDELQTRIGRLKAQIEQAETEQKAGPSAPAAKPGAAKPTATVAPAKPAPVSVKGGQR